MRIYIGIKFKKDNSALLATLKRAIAEAGHEPYAFVDEPYIEDADEMMRRALGEIDASDILVLECSEPAFGVGIEAGYAQAKNKRIIAVAREGGEPSRTIKGIADAYLVYATEEELRERLKRAIR